MTAAVTDLRGDPSSRRLLWVSLAVVAVIGGSAAYLTFTYVGGLWDGRHDIAVDWDPGTPSDMSVTPESDDGAALPYIGLRDADQMVIFDLADQQVVADLGDVDEIRWLSDDVLVAFAHSGSGDFEGLAAVDLGEQTVEQVDTGGQADRGFTFSAFAPEGLLVCTLPAENSSNACGPDRFLLDPTSASLSPA